MVMRQVPWVPATSRSGSMGGKNVLSDKACRKLNAGNLVDLANARLSRASDSAEVGIFGRKRPDPWLQCHQPA